MLTGQADLAKRGEDTGVIPFFLSSALLQVYTRINTNKHKTVQVYVNSLSFPVSMIYTFLYTQALYPSLPYSHTQIEAAVLRC